MQTHKADSSVEISGVQTFSAKLWALHMSSIQFKTKLKIWTCRSDRLSKFSNLEPINDEDKT